jgi:PX domain
MLQSFLNRLAQHPILRRDHVVHRFLTGDASWVTSPNTNLVLSIQNEVLHTPPISLLPKNILKAPPVNPAAGDGDQRYKGMLIPKQSGKLKVLPSYACTKAVRSPTRKIGIFRKWMLQQGNMNKSLAQELKRSSED